jgi:hypothetical protein
MHRARQTILLASPQANKAIEHPRSSTKAY